MGGGTGGAEKGKFRGGGEESGGGRSQRRKRKDKAQCLVVCSLQFSRQTQPLESAQPVDGPVSRSAQDAVTLV